MRIDTPSGVKEAFTPDPFARNSMEEDACSEPGIKNRGTVDKERAAAALFANRAIRSVRVNTLVFRREREISLGKSKVPVKRLHRGQSR